MFSEIRWIGSEFVCLSKWLGREDDPRRRRDRPHSYQLAGRWFRAYFFIATTGKVCMVCASRTSLAARVSAGSKMKVLPNSANLSE